MAEYAKTKVNKSIHTIGISPTKAYIDVAIIGYKIFIKDELNDCNQLILI